VVVTSNDLARFEAVMLPHLDAAYTLARYWARNEHDAEDIVQDAYLRALRHFGTYRGEGGASARAWLLAIVRNAAHSWRRRGRVDALSTEFDDSAHSPEEMDERADAALDRGDARDTLRRALNRLAPEFREVIVLRELKGLSYKEISAVAGVPVGTVMSRLSRARSRLQEALHHEEGR
jgi:RNA polymerase sigma-70 factor (ECF subfamily)